jgi:hypothetical protein
LAHSDDHILSFIIKLWIDDETDSPKTTWQGTITHVPSGKRKTIQSIQEIDSFILAFLEKHPLSLDKGKSFEGDFPQ